MKYIYIATSGEYDSYTIDAVFLDHKMADAYVEKRKQEYDWYHGRVEIHEINRELDYTIEGYDYYQIYFKGNELPTIHKSIVHNIDAYRQNNNIIYVSLKARSEEEALSLAEAERQKIINRKRKKNA